VNRLSFGNRGFRTRLVLIAIVVIGVPLAAMAVSAIRYARMCGIPRSSCLEHRTAGCSLDGNYDIRLGTSTIEASCDMKSDGGGWTLVGNYLHRAKKDSTSVASPLNGRLPLVGSSSLGNDETLTDHWGHAGTTTLSALPFSEIRFSCRSSVHTRKMDFAVSTPGCLDYFKTGKGACLASPADRPAWIHGTRTLPGHDAALPAKAEKGWKDQGENALVAYPFFLDWKAHWSVGTAQNRWECDDYEQQGGKADTHHQIWIR
jgi:hypothetical protein